MNERLINVNEAKLTRAFDACVVTITPTGREEVKRIFTNSSLKILEPAKNKIASIQES